MATTVRLAVSLAALLPTAGSAAATDAWCIAPPTMTWADACLTACDTPALYNLCQETLLQAPDGAAAAATAYALAAARRAMASLGATAARAERLLRGGWFPGPEREACWRCVDDYLDARSRMAVVVGDLAGGCAIAQTRAEYVRAVAALERCAGALSGFRGSPLVALNAADRDLAVLAYALGALIVGT
ncbi:hypothetical protein C2845_PM13G02640 [Panicum miliaceum]|uniref:Uncharacterized protein n=1 Tax=Panicum miliaceum TaxID=4540 RepID=A0A3L6RJZ4_PANMI|nr:hypothetical protein C2845_PM13G02640 [Panicum miliaceum]